MVVRVYTSATPAVPVHRRSVFTHLFGPIAGSGTVGNYPGSHLAFIDGNSGIGVTRQQLRALSLCFAHGLLHHPQLLPQRRGNTVLLFSSNTFSFPVVLFGTVAAGLKCSPANSGYTSRELAHQYSDSGAQLIVTSRDGLAVVLQMLTNFGLSAQDCAKRIVVLDTDLAWVGVRGVDRTEPRVEGFVMFKDLLKTGTLDVEESFDGAQADETCYICYSSGTTGHPKGVETTHQNITTVVDIGNPALPFVHGQDKLLGVLPLFHIYGAVGLLHIPFAAGVTVIIQNRFDPAVFCGNIQKYRITVAMVVPPILVVLARHNVVEQFDLNSLRVLFSAAAPLGKELIHQVTKRFRLREINVTVVQGYGLTETSPIATILPSSAGIKKAGSIGLLLPNLELRLVSEIGGKVADAIDGRPGELWLRGPTIMKRYLNNPTATAESITPDGWFKSGDICERDGEGYYWIVARKKELIKYKGFQVAPSELESVLLTHAEVADVAVVGVEDLNDATELPRAYVVHINPETMATRAAKVAFQRKIAQWVESRVANHKHLRGGVSLIDTIPKSAAGKILRKELQELAKSEFEANRGDLAKL